METENIAREKKTVGQERQWNSTSRVTSSLSPSREAQQEQNPSTKYIMASSVREILRGDGLQRLDGIRE